MATQPTELLRTAGLQMGPGAGKFLFRIRQSHIANHYCPLIARKSVGAVKLDLVLRSIALLPDHAGARAPGFVLWNWTFEDLHDLARGEPVQRHGDGPRDEDKVRHLKRKWVSDQLIKLAQRRLVKLKARPGRRPEILVLRDDGRGRPLDDPGELGGTEGDRYVTILGSLIASGTLAGWEAPEVAAYLAAIYAEAHNDRGGGRTVKSDGSGSWFRQLAWFSDATKYPTYREPLTFSKSLLEDGLAAHIESGLITVTKMSVNPATNRRLVTERNHYTDHFDKFNSNVSKMTPDRFERALEEAEE